MIYFTSDLHLGHGGIISMKHRPFNDVYEMNKVLIDNFNFVVKKHDTVYILGDICFKLGIDAANQYIKLLNGKKYLIKGNHDKTYDVSLFEEITDFKVISLDNLIIALMHYPMLSWPHSHYGSLHLHGHIHSNMNYNIENRSQNIYRYDVGVDANSYKPVSLDQIKKFFKIGFPKEICYA